MGGDSTTASGTAEDYVGGGRADNWLFSRASGKGCVFLQSWFWPGDRSKRRGLNDRVDPDGQLASGAAHSDVFGGFCVLFWDVRHADMTEHMSY